MIETKATSKDGSVSPLTTRLSAGVIGIGVQTLGRVLTIPIYLRLLGAANYGLIGFYATLNGVTGILDAGISTAINRELSRLASDPEHERDAQDTARTLEIIYWSIGLSTGSIIAMFAPVLAKHWLSASEITPHTVALAIAIMAVNFTFQWPDSFYSGALFGLHRHVRVNQIRITITIIQALGTVFCLTTLSPSILIYFACAAVSSLAQTMLLRHSMWRALKGKCNARFRLYHARRLLVFAGGTTLIGILGTILTQLDKITLSHVFPLEIFGYYSLATSAAAATFFLAAPVMTAVFPDMSRLAKSRDEKPVAALYHRTCQILASLVLPILAFAFTFANDVLLIYLRNPTAVRATSHLYQLLLVGTALNLLVTPAFYLQLAYGWTSLSVMKNVIAVLLYIPLLTLSIRYLGLVGAASMWIVVNGGYVFAELPIMHTRLLSRGHQLWRWYTTDLIVPLCISASMACVAEIMASRFSSSASRLVISCAFGAGAVIVTGLVLPECRYAIVRVYQRYARPNNRMRIN